MLQKLWLASCLPIGQVVIAWSKGLPVATPKYLLAAKAASKLVIWRHWHRTFLYDIESLRNVAWVVIIGESNKYFEKTPSNKVSILIKHVDIRVNNISHIRVNNISWVPRRGYWVLTENVCKPLVYKNFSKNCRPMCKQWHQQPLE